jgi:trans-L-3-hydroxyproline dehydratase
MAIHHARGEINVGEIMSIESIVGSVFMGSVIKEVDFGPFKAVIPEVEGEAFVTGQHTFLIDPQDPFKEGLFLR